jgi:NAD-dependent dihydropyrimidine dehydrogenase PreA subunit
MSNPSDSQLVTVAIHEMKAPSAWEVEGGTDNAATRGFDACLRYIEIVRIQDNERAAWLRRAMVEAAREPAIAKLAVVGAVILECPAEGLAIESLCGLDGGYGKFEVIDAVMLVGAGHGGLGKKGEMPLSCIAWCGACITFCRTSSIRWSDITGSRNPFLVVIPAQAGTPWLRFPVFATEQMLVGFRDNLSQSHWASACAGMTTTGRSFANALTARAALGSS